MPFNLEWIWWIAQIAIDVILLSSVFVLLGKLKKNRASGQAPAATEDFVEQASHLAREFDRLLGEKRELVNTTLATLDARIGELKAMLEQTRALQEKIQSQGITPNITHQGRGQEILGQNLPAPSMALVDDPFELPPGHPLHQLKEEENLLNTEQNFRSQVMSLLGQGRSAQEIANATGHPRAEVELLIALIK